MGNEKVVQAFGYQDEAQKRFEEINGRLQGYSLRAIFFSSITNPATRFVNSMVYASVGVAGAFAAILRSAYCGTAFCVLKLREPVYQAVQ